MPQVDLEALVSVCGGSNVPCKPVSDEAPDNPDTHEAADVPPDFPPESFWLSGDAEFDWFDRNAFLERKESTKGNANSTNLNRSNSNLQRFSVSLKSKASIIGLPKTQKNTYADKSRNTKPTNIRLFPPKGSESMGKSTALMTEPSSPKVSCIGRVRSKRGRRRKQSKPEKPTVKPAQKTRSAGGEKKKGFRSALMSLFHSDRDKAVVKIDEPSVKSSSRKSRTCKKRSTAGSGEEAAEPPGLGGMTRFVSGRRSESWVVEDDSTDLDRSSATTRGGGSTRLPKNV